MTGNLQIILTDMSKDLLIIPADMPRNLQIFLRFSPFFSDFLLFLSEFI